MSLNSIRPAALALMLLAAVVAPAASQQPPQTNPADALPLEPQREIAFTTTEGSWMSVDVSPDGRTIVFDHLGDLYLLPIQGGRAQRLLGGMAFDVQPRFSPDGRSIAFVSDRSGKSAVWVIGRDGSGLRQISPDSDPTLFEYEAPTWTPDGAAIVAIFTHVPSGGTRITQYPARGEAPAIDYVTPERDRGFHIYSDPSFSRDGRYLYLTAALEETGETFLTIGQRNGRMTLARLDTQTREIARFETREGGAMAPLVSHGGDFLLYASRDYNSAETVLRRFDLSSGEDRVLTRPVQFDLQETQYLASIPRYALTRDDRTLIMSRDGGLWRVDVESGRQTRIPFEVDVRLEAGALSQFSYEYDDDAVSIRAAIAPALSPDGEALAFAAAGGIWIAATRSGGLRRLTPAHQRAQEAAWSPDGRFLVYSTWDADAGQGEIWRIDAGGQTQPRRLAQRQGRYRELLVTPRGDGVVARAPAFPRSSRYGYHVALRPLGQVEQRQRIVFVPFAQGRARTLAALTGDWGAHGTTDFSRVLAQGGLYVSGERLYYRENYTLNSISFGGGDHRVELPPPTNDVPSEIVLSPSGERAIRSRSNTDFSSGVTLETVARDASGALNFSNRRPLRMLADIEWSADGRFFWGFEDMRFVRYDLAAFEANPGAYEPYEIELALNVPRVRPSGSVVLRGARIITMRGNEIIERGDIVVTGNRIAAVGVSGTLAIPDGAAIIDVEGRTILPGWVDIHSHNSHSWDDYARARRMADLAYGVTAIRDPSTNIWPLPAWDELAAGWDIGPRPFGSGLALRNLEGASDDFLRYLVARYATGMRTETLKQYRSGGRALRQRLIRLAYEYRLSPTNEVLEDFWSNLSLVIDGYAGIEHTPGITPYYDDIVQLVARSGTTWTPTLSGAGPDSYPDDYIAYLLADYDLEADARYQRFTPRIYQSDPRDVYRVRAYERYLTPRAARDAARVLAAGGRVGLGSHGNVSGLGVHLELWTLAEGGMPLHDLLRAGTIMGAEAIGHGRDFGSIEAGKLADLQILDRNPLDDIRNSLSVSMVMANGFLYETESLDQVWPDRRPLPRQWWQDGAAR